MNNTQTLIDKTAISLSALCTLHCLVSPLLIVLLPNLTALQLNNEAFHIWLMAAVMPTSTYALVMGCKRHKHYQIFISGLIGLSCLVLALILSGKSEKVLTTLGAGIIAYGHYRNYRLCQHEDNCHCKT